MWCILTKTHCGISYLMWFLAMKPVWINHYFRDYVFSPLSECCICCKLWSMQDDLLMLFCKVLLYPAPTIFVFLPWITSFEYFKEWAYEFRIRYLFVNEFWCLGLVGAIIHVMKYTKWIVSVKRLVHIKPFKGLLVKF